MMLKKLLTNKATIIGVVVLLLALCIGVIIFVNSGTKETSGKDGNTKTEQDEELADSKEDKEETDAIEDGDGKENSSTGLEILKPEEVHPDDSSNASGDWNDTTEANTQTGNSSITDEANSQTNNTTNRDEADQEKDDTSSSTDKKDDDEKKDEDILKDNINWGNVY